MNRRHGRTPPRRSIVSRIPRSSTRRRSCPCTLHRSEGRRGTRTRRPHRLRHRHKHCRTHRSSPRRSGLPRTRLRTGPRSPRSHTSRRYRGSRSYSVGRTHRSDRDEPRYRHTLQHTRPRHPDNDTRLPRTQRRRGKPRSRRRSGSGRRSRRRLRRTSGSRPPRRCSRCRRRRGTSPLAHPGRTRRPRARAHPSRRTPSWWRRGTPDRSRTAACRSRGRGRPPDTHHSRTPGCSHRALRAEGPRPRWVPACRTRSRRPRTAPQSCVQVAWVTSRTDSSRAPPRIKSLCGPAPASELGSASGGRRTPARYRRPGSGEKIETRP